MALYSLEAGLMLQMFDLWFIFFSFTQLNKRRIFLLRCLVWLSSFYIRGNNYELVFCFVKKIKFAFLNSFVSKKISFSIWIFFYNHSQITGLQQKGEGISLTPHYHFHLLHRHLDVSRTITAESSPLHIGSSQTRTGNLWFLSASC